MPPFLLASRLGYTVDLGAAVLYALFVVLLAWLLWLTLREEATGLKPIKLKRKACYGRTSGLS